MSQPVHNEDTHPIIAKLCLQSLRAEGQTSSVTFSLRLPKKKRSQFGCQVVGDGLEVWAGVTEIVGVDSWQALRLALEFVKRMLEAESQRGVEFYYFEEPVQIPELFPCFLTEE